MNKYQMINVTASTLYIVPTPIGNLGDITYRALSVLQNVDLIAAEDTRHTGLLLHRFAINTPLFALHNYNEHQKLGILLNKLQEGKSIALVSDAGTPLINDPGYHLVCSCHEAGFYVVPLPGACAAITALSAAGLPSNRFCYEGFLPSKRKSRLNYLQSLAREPRTMIFYDSINRLLESLQDMVDTLGAERHIVLARELTKTWESICRTQVGKLLVRVQQGEIWKRGEITMIVEGYYAKDESFSLKTLHTLKLLMTELPMKKAVALVANIYGIKKNILYRYVIDQQKKILV